MTSGDEPMLSQPIKDNSPMISGRATKLIADMRGAYSVGNVAALADRMGEVQAFRFRKALVGLMGHFCPTVIEYLSSEFAGILHRWLISPDPTSKQLLIEQLEPQVAAIYSEEHGGIFYRPGHTSVLPVARHLELANVIVATMPHAVATALLMAAIGSASNQQQYEAANRLLKQWAVETAWAILHGKEPLPFPELRA